MKTIKFLAIMTVAAMLASCGSSRNTSNGSSSPSYSRNVPDEVEINLPCNDASLDDDEYFRALGTAKNINRENAREAAWDAARVMIRKRLAEFVEGLSTGYSRTVAGQAAAEKVQRLMEGEMTGVVSDMLNHAQKTCEKLTQSSDGNYNSYIAIQIPKGQMVNKMANVLSANEELEEEFNRDQFRKYAEGKMAQMKEAQKAAGY